MKKFSELRAGQEFFCACSISEIESDAYMDFSRVKNDFLRSGPGKVISGRAVLSRMEGEFTQQSEVCWNHLVFVGTDGDPEWGNRSTRFLRPLHADEILGIKFTVSGKDDIDEEFGRIAVD